MTSVSSGFGIPSLILFLVQLVPSSDVEAQGPRTSHFFNPLTEVPWAESVLYQEGGSFQRIPFLPVIAAGPFRAPLGTGNLTRDVAVDGPLVFIGNGIVHEDQWNSYVGRRHDLSRGEIDVAGRVVLFSFDGADGVEEEFGPEAPISKRIAEAARRGAAAVVLFSTRERYPFLLLPYRTPSEVPEIPVITVDRQSVLNIFAASGVFGESILDEWSSHRVPPESRELITRMRIGIDGRFETVESENFSLRYPRDAYCADRIVRISELNEESLVFLRRTLQDRDTVKWDKLSTVFFPGFDIKLFFTHHWGRGLASDEGVFNVYDGGEPDFGLIVHENMHILARLNWSRNTTSFLAEGIAMYVEAQATDHEGNHRRTIEYLKEGHLFPLESMATFQIGVGGLKTDVAYPASGSFTAYLIENYGLRAFREVYALEGRRPEEREAKDSWEQAYGMSLRELERSWLRWLAGKYRIDDDLVTSHLKRVSEARSVVDVDLEVLEDYVGAYRMSPDVILGISRKGRNLSLDWGGQGTFSLLPSSETEFFSKLLDGMVTFVRDEEGFVTHMVLERCGEKSKIFKDRANQRSGSDDCQSSEGHQAS